MARKTTIILFALVAWVSLTSKAALMDGPADGVAVRLDALMGEAGLVRGKALRVTRDGAYTAFGYATMDCSGALQVLPATRNAESAHIPELLAGTDRIPPVFILHGQRYGSFPATALWLARAKKALLRFIDVPPSVVRAVRERGSCGLIDRVPWKRL